MEKRNRGFRLVKVFNWSIHSRRAAATAYKQLQPSVGPISKLCTWVSSLKRGGARGICSGTTKSGYNRVGQEPVEKVKSPKGHLAVYVGDKQDDTCRVMVPVMYFNHPLFGELLREAEKVYGFDHPGGIQIPCPVSEVENVRNKIAAVSGSGRWRRRWSP